MKLNFDFIVYNSVIFAENLIVPPIVIIMPIK